jgi:hypothetical protein
MSKKIKITEDQLKRLMVLKEENQGLDDFDTQVQPEELSSTEYDGVNDMNDSNEELERMVDSFIRQYKERATQGVDEDMVNNLCDKIRQGLGGEESQSEYEMPGYQEDMDNLNNLSIREDDDTVNESVQKIKSNFKRFL